MNDQELLDAVPLVPRLASRILNIVESGEGAVKMAYYHYCDTVHCLAGWATHLAGFPKYQGPPGFSGSTMELGEAIWLKVYGEHPRFAADTTDEEAMEELRRFAAQDSEPSP